MALAKFGTFSNLLGTTSSAREADPGTPTFSFYRAGYSSKYLTLVTDELETNKYVGDGEYPLLQFPTRQEMNMISTWDVAPYTAKAGSIPFAYIGGKFIVTSAQYNAAGDREYEVRDGGRHDDVGHERGLQAGGSGCWLPGRGPVRPDPRPARVGLLAAPPSLIGITRPPARLKRPGDSGGLVWCQLAAV